MNDNSTRIRTIRLALLLTLLWSPSVLAQSTGSILGVIVDEDNAETLIGANVVIVGTTTGTTTDINGRYRFDELLPGNYSLKITYIGYNSVLVKNVRVESDLISTLNINLISEAVEFGEVTVEARVIRNNGAILLRDRQKAPGVSDAISAEEISRSGSSTAADALKKVTGVSVVSGKYVYVRGLGDRYVNTQLNGTTLPSADPDRNAVALDIFPAGLLDNIVITKTFTPDKPGNFTGGSVNIATKDFPDQFTLSLSSSLSYNSNVGLGGNHLFFKGGQTGLFGTNSSLRGLPTLFRDPGLQIPTIGESFTDAGKAHALNTLSGAFSNTMSPSVFSAPVNRSYGLSLGNQISLFGRDLGFIGGFTYSRSRSGYTGGKSARYKLTGKISDVSGLDRDFNLADQKGGEEVLWGGLLNTTYKLGSRHQIGFNFMMNRSTNASARFQVGAFPRDLSADAIYETRVIQFVERSLYSYQLKGDHSIGHSRLKWNSSLARSNQDEPDLRYFTDNYSIVDRAGRIDTLYSVQASVYPVPTRYFRKMKEKSWSSNLDWSIPVRSWNAHSGKLKFGASYTQKTRSFAERRFEFRTDSRSAKYQGNPGDFFSSDNVGILAKESTDNFFRFGNYVVDATQLSSNYVGDQQVLAVYGMVEWPLTRSLRLIAGARFETTSMGVASQDTTLSKGHLSNHDLLPSANLVYSLTDRMNLRFAYGRTLARPVFRELAPYASFDFVGDYIFVGNPDLQRTLIDNIDLRWEWFVNPGEILAVSGYHMAFQDPIERAINPIAANPEVQFRNVGHASVSGIELEARKNLKRLSGSLRHLSIGGNVSLVHSSVDIAEDELALIRAFDSNASSTRPLMGQSDYTANADATYDNPSVGITISVYYNVFGRRLDKVSIGGTPDIYELPQHVLDLTIQQNIWNGWTLSLSVKNALNSSSRRGHEFKGKTYITSQFELGRSYALGLKFRP